MADNTPEGLSDSYWDLFPEDNITSAVREANKELSSRSKASMKEAHVKVADGEAVALKPAAQEYMELASMVEGLQTALGGMLQNVGGIGGSLMAHHDTKVGSLITNAQNSIGKAGETLVALADYLKSEGAKLSGAKEEKAPEPEAEEESI